ELGIASLSEQRIESADTLEDTSAETEVVPPSEGSLQWHANLRLAYQEYLSGNSDVRAQRDLGIGLNVAAMAFPGQKWSFAVTDDFVRDTRPTNFESTSNLNRDINHLALAMLLQPPGRTLFGDLRYENTIDFFEQSSQRFANRIQHTAAARVNWQW